MQREHLGSRLGFLLLSAGCAYRQRQRSDRRGSETGHRTLHHQRQLYHFQRNLPFRGAGNSEKGFLHTGRKFHQVQWRHYGQQLGYQCVIQDQGFGRDADFRHHVHRQKDSRMRNCWSSVTVRWMPSDFWRSLAFSQRCSNMLTLMSSSLSSFPSSLSSWKISSS